MNTNGQPPTEESLAAYGLTLQTWIVIFKYQKRRCGICGDTHPGGNSVWHTDHDHMFEQLTGEKKARGILCHSCNVNLTDKKPVVEWPEHLQPAVEEYLKRNPAVFALDGYLPDSPPVHQPRPAQRRSRKAEHITQDAFNVITENRHDAIRGMVRLACLSPDVPSPTMDHLNAIAYWIRQHWNMPIVKNIWRPVRKDSGSDPKHYLSEFESALAPFMPDDIFDLEKFRDSFPPELQWYVEPAEDRAANAQRMQQEIAALKDKAIMMMVRYICTVNHRMRGTVGIPYVYQQIQNYWQTEFAQAIWQTVTDVAGPTDIFTEIELFDIMKRTIDARDNKINLKNFEEIWQPEHQWTNQ